uniref:Carbonic anhydrase n=1 Tax=Globisporangium ultimum (strain ATCC 200006 / CBS 805.95 / DAOM BR144) TaxID=431595 RepID=K3WJL8_GLOUD
MKIFSLAVAFAGLLSAANAVSAVAADSVVAEGEKSYGYKENDASMYGPSQWAAQYPTSCAGKRQSPINIASKTSLTKGSRKQPLQFAGSCSSYKMTQTEDSYKGTVQGGSCTLAANGASYSMSQFHIHAPSEHTVNGKVYDGEVHFVHSNADGSKLLVVGAFLEKKSKGKTDPWVASVFNAANRVNSTASVDVSLESYSKVLLSAASKGREFNYPGSLTTPTCSEIVDWWVLEQPLQVSSADFVKFQANLKKLHATDNGRNARPTQPLNGRTITVY